MILRPLVIPEFKTKTSVTGPRGNTTTVKMTTVKGSGGKANGQKLLLIENVVKSEKFQEIIQGLDNQSFFV